METLVAVMHLLSEKATVLNAGTPPARRSRSVPASDRSHFGAKFGSGFVERYKSLNL